MVSVLLSLAWLTPIHCALPGGKHSVVYTHRISLPLLCWTLRLHLEASANPGVLWVSHRVDLFLGFWEAFVLILTVARLPYIPISSTVYIWLSFCSHPSQHSLLFVFLKSIYFYFLSVHISVGIHSGFLNICKPPFFSQWAMFLLRMQFLHFWHTKTTSSKSTLVWLPSWILLPCFSPHGLDTQNY